MNLLEEIFKNRFKNKTSLQGIDKDDLWAGISGEISDDITVNNRSRYKWGLLALLIFFFGFISYNTFNEFKKGHNVEIELPSKIATSTVDSKDQKSTPTLSEMESIAMDIDKDTETNTKSLTDTNTSYKTNTKTETNSETNAHYKTNTNTDFNFDTNIDHNNEMNPNHKTNTNADHQTNTNTDLNSDTKTEYNFNKKEKQERSYPNENIALKKSNNISTTNKIAHKSKNSAPVSSLLLTTMQAPIFNPEEKTGSPIIPKKIKNTPFEIGLQFGINSLILNYKKTNSNTALVNDLSQSISSSVGYSAELRITYLINDKYSLSSGIQYNKLQTILDRTSESNTTILDDDLKLRNAVATRVVLHHSQYQMIAIPLEMGRHKQYEKFDIGVNLGLSYNFMFSQKGKAIDSEQSVVEFDSKNSTTLPYRKSFFAYQFGIYADAKIGSRFKLRLNPVFKYMPLGTSALHGVQQDVMKIGIKGGIIYRL